MAIKTFVVPEGTIYTGIGSRKTPPDICELMEQLAEKLAEKGAVLRSGNADGADKAFEAGCDRVYGAKDIFTVKNWYFRELSETVTSQTVYKRKEWQEAERIAAQYHPTWTYLKPYARKLHTRNCFQVLGEELKRPSDFLFCWTSDGATTETTQKTGGTGQAIRIALAHDVQIYNLANSADLELVKYWLG
jgi:hypothetical protein